MATMMDPGRLSGLKQASFVMQCLTEGQSSEEIAASLGGDMQLVAMWISFLRHNHWMIADDKGWAVTAKGARWSRMNSNSAKSTS
jgi:hypothetical protein